MINMINNILNVIRINLHF